MDIVLITKLLLAHIAGDFFLQPKKWIQDKEEQKWKSPFLFIHVVIHFGLIIMILWDLSAWKAALFIAITHYVIDGLKLSFQKNNPVSWFIADQIAHFTVIFLAVHLFWEPIYMAGFEVGFWVIFTGIIFLTFPSAYIMQNILSIWNDEVLNDENGSLAGAGLYIGILERLLVFISVITGYMQVVGFLLAAKSVFRFSDLTREKDRKLTEYIIVGTLLSFLLAIVTALITQAVL